MKGGAVDSMMGFYLLSGEGLAADEDGLPSARLPLKDKASAQPQLVHESCFAPTLEVGCTVELGAGEAPTALVLVPATYGPGVQGPFEIELACEEPISWRELT